jgi:hypothetical protein
MKKAAPTYKTGDDELFQLFDIGEMEHVCELVKDSYDPAPKGHRNGLAQSLTRLLLQPVENMIQRLHETGRGANASEFNAADELRTCTENVSKLLAMSDGATCSKDEASELAGDLCNAWTKFIAYGSAFRMYHDMPREVDTNKRKTAAMREARDALAYGSRVDHHLVIERYAELVAARARGKRKTVAAEFDLSENTVKNIWNSREK